jgi:hypothetical protein
MTFILSIFFFIHSTISFAHSPTDWGKTGHRATAEIAVDYLSTKAKRKIQKILEGKSLALVSTYADEIKSDPRYREFFPWHYANIPEGKNYRESEKNPEGDLVTAIKTCIEKLKNPNTSREDQAFYLKLLVHFMGDLHQPLHFGRKSDKGGNDFQVRWFGKGSNLHRVWDSEMIDNYKMSYTELAANQKELTKSEFENIRKGDIEDWANESHQLAIKIYNSTEIGEKLKWRYMYDWFPLVREQLQKGGIRLAKVLDDIFR